jgi:hypothetical protein
MIALRPAIGTDESQGKVRGKNPGNARRWARAVRWLKNPIEHHVPSDYLD